MPAAWSLSIINFHLNQFDWKPESIVEKDETYTISLLAEVDDGSHKLYIKFAEDSKWIYFSSKFVTVNNNNKNDLYEKLLSLNYLTTLTKFGLAPSGSVYAMIELPLPELNYSEFVSGLRRLVNDINKYKKEIIDLPAS